eukprot:m.262038 g.262038  ORF g.262038 m.262038 type:complete len:252 (-) comp44173_c0_seq1:54-809(-)
MSSLLLEAKRVREIATVANCLLCDSYFCVIVGTAPAWKEVRGKEGTKILEDILEKLQLHTWKRYGWHLIFCPSCVSLATRMPFNEWTSGHPDSVPQASLSLCRLVEFEPGELHPLYHNPNTVKDGAKPKWELVQGVGPPALELVGKSYRIHKPTLRQFGVKVDPQYPPRSKTSKGSKLPPPPDPVALEKDFLGGQTHMQVAQEIESWVMKSEKPMEEIEATCKELEELRPLYSNWATAQHVVRLAATPLIE